MFESVYHHFLLSNNNALPYFASLGESKLLVFTWALVLSFLLGREVKLYVLVCKFLMFVITAYVFSRQFPVFLFVCLYKATT